MTVTPPASEFADVDLGSLDFWGRPAEVRDEYFAHLRRSQPISRHEPPEDILGLPQQGRLHYWAIVRYEDIRRISRDAATFCSGEGVQFADAPPEMLEALSRFWPWTLRATPSCAAWSPPRSPRARSSASRTESASAPSGSSPRRRPPAAAISWTSSPSGCRCRRSRTCSGSRRPIANGSWRPPTR